MSRPHVATNGGSCPAGSPVSFLWQSSTPPGAATPLRLVVDLVRHGETLWNQEGRFQGHQDSPLSADGRAQARSLGRALAGMRYGRIYMSPAGRAQETCALLLEGLAEHAPGLAQPSAVADDDLRELGFGSWEGAEIAAVGRRAPLRLLLYRHLPPLYPAPRGAESYRHLVARARRFMTEQLLAAAPSPQAQPDGERVLVVSHALTTLALLLLMEDQPLRRIRQHFIRPASLTRVVLDRSGHWHSLGRGLVQHETDPRPGLYRMDEQ